MDLKPYFSLIITVTHGNMHLLSFTLKSIEEQGFKSFEVVIVHNIEKELSLCELERERCHIRVICHIEGAIAALRNRALEETKGDYVHFLDAGEFYLSSHSLASVKEFLEENVEADLLYTGYIHRHSMAPSEQVFEPITLPHLRQGMIAPGFSSYWFKRKTLEGIGAFDERLQSMPGYDLLCRIFRRQLLTRLFMRRIITDYEYRKPSLWHILGQTAEILFVMLRHFGLNAAPFRWIVRNQWRLLKWWGIHLKGAFWKTPANPSSG